MPVCGGRAEHFFEQFQRGSVDVTALAPAIIRVSGVTTLRSARSAVPAMPVFSVL